MMHRLLARQLKKLGLDASSTPDAQQWESLVGRISDTFQQADSDRYTLERSLQISSDEIQEMYQRQKVTAEGRMQALVNALPDLVFMLDEDGRYVEVIAGDEERLFLPVEKIKGRLLTEILPRDQAAAFLDAVTRSLQTNALHVLEYELSVPAGKRIFEGRIMPTGLKINDRQTVVFLARDVTELATSRNLLQHIATHDALTDLPNRNTLDERLVQAIARSKRHRSCGALMVLDLDRFKQVNDSLGHQVGDQLLLKVAKRLRAACRREDTVVRFGGDEFVIILEDLHNAADAGCVARHILEAFSEPMRLEGFDLDVTASIGISMFPDEENGDELLRHADNAMYAAKEAGRNQYAYYTQELGDNALAYLAMESRLRKAIDNEELLLLYQPQFRLEDGALVGLEALVRWPTADPDHRSPAAFIPVAEMSGLIEPLGLWVLNEACRQASCWRKSRQPFSQIAVNLSCRQLSNPLLAEHVMKILGNYGLPGSVLELEITESMVLQDGGVAYANLEAFSEMGITLAIDDFGTGHSSLANLKRLPLSRLKIDRSFVDGLGEDRNDEAITAASIALAKQLGLEVVAEGVETEVQALFLRQHACEMVQGFLYAKPMSADEIEEVFGGKLAGLG